jgi:hypothetical protein
MINWLVEDPEREIAVRIIATRADQLLTGLV